MLKRQSVIEVKITLDDIPGWGYESEDHIKMIQKYLDGTIKHYNPSVKLVRIDTIK